MFAKAITTHEPEHRRILRANCADYIASRPLSDVRTLVEARSFSRDRYRQMAALGWLGVEAMGGGELDARDLVALHRELGRGVTPEPVIASGVLAAELLARSDAPGASGLLQRVCSGDTIATLGWQGRPHAAGAANCAATARRGDGGWLFSATLRFVPWAASADAVLIAAQTGDGIIIGWLGADHPQLSIRPGSGIDMSEFATVTLNDAFVADADVVCPASQGARVLDEVLDLARLAASAELVGAAEGVFDMTLGYLRQRRQFGKPVGANQAVQFIATDIFVQIELANSVLAAAARTFAARTPDAAQAVARCKARCGDAAMFAARQAIQLHGAIGYTHECDVSLFVRRIMQLNAWLGNPDFHRQRICRERAAQVPAHG